MKRTIIQILAVLLLTVPALAAGPAASIPRAQNANPGVLPINSMPYGMTYGEWAAAWTQWLYAIPSDNNPAFDTTGADCAQGQAGPVWFLAGTTGFPATRTCTVPVGTAIFFPIIAYTNDYPCPDPSFQPAPGQSLADFLTEGAQAAINGHVTVLDVEVDGVSLKNLERYRATSPLFTFTGDPSLTATFDACVTGSPQSGVSDGYWIMLAPLSRGPHVIRFQAATDFGFALDVTYGLTVARRKP